MLGMMVILIIRTDIATYCVNIIESITAVYISLRLGYTGKAAWENHLKIKQNDNHEDDS